MEYRRLTLFRRCWKWQFDAVALGPPERVQAERVHSSFAHADSMRDMCHCLCEESRFTPKSTGFRSCMRTLSLSPASFHRFNIMWLAIVMAIAPLLHVKMMPASYVQFLQPLYGPRLVCNPVGCFGLHRLATAGLGSWFA